MTHRYRHATTCLLLAAFLAATPCLAAGADPYAAGVRKVQQAVAGGDLRRAEELVKKLSARYGENAELLSIRARLLFWQKRYDASIAAYSAALKLRPGRELRDELERVQTARQLAKADRLLAGEGEGKARKILEQLFESGRAEYEAGVRLARLKMKNEDPAGASVILKRLLSRFPKQHDLVLFNAQALLAAGTPQRALDFIDGREELAGDPELLALRARALSRLERFREAERSYRLSLALADDPQVRREAERAAAAALLRRSEEMTAAGDTSGAEALLRDAFEAGADRYGVGLKLASIYTRSGRHAEAAAVYQRLAAQYPKDRELPLLQARALALAGSAHRALELLGEQERKEATAEISALRGRILFWQGSYLEAREEYRRALLLGADPALLAAEQDEVAEALDYRELVLLVSSGRSAEAKPLLERLSLGEGRYARQARLMKMRLLIAEREAERAVAFGAKLCEETDPEDPACAALYAEALILAGDGREAARVLREVPGEAGIALRRERQDLVYRATRNWIKGYAGAYGFSDGYRSEESAGIAVSTRFRRFTAVSGLSRTSRFGKTDTQAALDLYFAKRARDLYYGSLSLTLSPGASFLPRNSFGGEITRPFGSFELSAAYNRLNFSDTGANVMSLGLLYYLPYALSLGERVYFAPGKGTATSVTTLRWDPDPRLSSLLSVGIGNSSERFSSGEDLQRYSTLSLRAGAEFRFTESYSIGAEGSFESRDGLYDRRGASVFLKYWWP